MRPFGGHILYTSGTTGTYKKLMMSGEHEDQRNGARAQFFSVDSNTIYHGIDFGLWTGIGFKIPSATWHVGGCVVLDQRRKRFENFFLHGVTFAIFIPAMLKELLRARGPLARPVYGFALAVGGGFLPIDLAEQSIQKLTDRLTVHLPIDRNLILYRYGHALEPKMICIGLCLRMRDQFRLSTKTAENVQPIKKVNYVFCFQILIATIILMTKRPAQEYSVMGFFTLAIWRSNERMVAYAYLVARPTS